MIGHEMAFAEEIGHHHHQVSEVINLNLLSSYTGGFGSLFSIWFFCLLQITPFFIAFLLGIAAMDSQKTGSGRGILRVVTAGILSLAGFSAIFSIIGASATSAAVILYQYLGLLNQLGGVFILLIGLIFLNIFKLPEGRRNSYLWPVIFSVGAVFFGMALAFAYKPCVTPTLSEIFNYTKNPVTVQEGFYFLLSYSAGISTSLLLVGITLAAIVILINNTYISKSVQIFSGLLMAIMGIMILTDWMVAYKSLLVGRFVQ